MMLKQPRPSQQVFYLLLLLGWLATYIRYVFSALLLPCPSPLFFTHSAELKEFYAAQPPQFTYQYIHLFFIFEYLFNLFLLYLFFIIQRSQQKTFGNAVVVRTGFFLSSKIALCLAASLTAVSSKQPGASEDKQVQGGRGGAAGYLLPPHHHC